MIRVAFLVAALALPALCSAETIWRWQDAAGTLHYSNRADRVPSYAEELRGTIGVVRMPRVGATPSVDTEREPTIEPASPAPRRGARRHHEHRYCGVLGYPFGFIWNSTDPSELVKQVSALDRVGIQWRDGCCH